MLEGMNKPISTQELKRRWKAVRQAMERAKLDCLIMQNNNQFLGGYTRYFTGIPAINGYTATVIFHLDREMTVISHGSPLATDPQPVTVSKKSKSSESAKDDVIRNITLPYLPTLNRTNSMDGDAVVDALKRLKVKSLGVVAPAILSAFINNYIKENLPGLDIKYATDLVDGIKAIKSREELEIIKETARMQDTVWGGVLSLVRPGVNEYELRTEIQRLCCNWGSEEQLIMVGSQPAGKPAVTKRVYFQNRTLQEGDQVCIMPEVNGAGGFYCELARTVCIGDAPKPLLKLWDFMVELQDEIAQRLKPGTDSAEIYKFYNNELRKRRCAPDLRLFCHGQGYDLVERPAMRPEEEMTVKVGMNLAVHPGTTNADKTAYAFCCDNFVVGDTGTYRIHKTPREVFVV